MSNIDYSQLVTAEDKATSAQIAHVDQIKSECSQLIVEVLDVHTVANVQGAAIANELSVDQMAVFVAARTWVASMQAACRTAIETGSDPVWPELPEGVAELAALF